ncbi:hypothetical protein MGH68_02385 [Erysipelothrix sp. D19-032]
MMKKRVKFISFYLIGFYVGAMIIAKIVTIYSEMNALLGTVVAGAILPIFVGYEMVLRLFYDPLTLPTYEHIEDGSNFSLGRAALTILQAIPF